MDRRRLGFLLLSVLELVLVLLLLLVMTSEFALRGCMRMGVDVGVGVDSSIYPPRRARFLTLRTILDELLTNAFRLCFALLCSPFFALPFFPSGRLASYFQGRSANNA